MKVLMITYGFPPVAGMSPLRCVHLARALVVRGHEVTVLTAEMPPEYPRDDAISALVPAEVEIIRVSSGRVSGFVRRDRLQSASGERARVPGKLISLIRTGMASAYHAFLKPLIFPDATVEWYGRARRRLESLISDSDFDVVYSFAYPFSCHYLGELASRDRSIPWIMDYGDPWSIRPFPKVPRWRCAVDYRQELRFLKVAEYHVVTTHATKDAYIRAFPEIPRDSWVVATCGYSPEIYAATVAAPRDPGRFRLVYTGIYGMANRCEIDLIGALQQLGDDRWELVLAGVNITGNDDELRKLCRDAGLADRVDIRGQLPHAEAIALQLSADLLVAWGWPGGMQIPAKIFEYIGARQPILLITGDENDAAAVVIRELNRGVVTKPDLACLVRALTEVLTNFWRGNWVERFDLAANDENSWHNQAGIVADLCEELAER